MALIKCPDCSTEVSDSAQKCLKCGKSLGRTFLGKIFNRLFIAYNLGGAVIIFLMVSISEPINMPVNVGLFGVFWGVGFCILFVLNFLTRP